MPVKEGAMAAPGAVLAQLDLRIEEIELARRQVLLDDQSELQRGAGPAGGGAKRSITPQRSSLTGAAPSRGRTFRTADSHAI